MATYDYSLKKQSFEIFEASDLEPSMLITE